MALTLRSSIFIVVDVADSHALLSNSSLVDMKRLADVNEARLITGARGFWGVISYCELCFGVTSCVRSRCISAAQWVSFLSRNRPPK